MRIVEQPNNKWWSEKKWQQNNTMNCIEFDDSAVKHIEAYDDADMLCHFNENGFLNDFPRRPKI